MKKILLFALLFTLSLNINAQTIKYTNGTIEFEDEPVETITLLLKPKVQEIEDKFEDWIDDNYNVNLKDKKMLFFDKEFMTANKVSIPEVSDKKLDLRVKVDQSMVDATTVHMFASFGYDNWITESEYPKEYNALKEILYQFIVEYLPEHYSEKIEDRKEVYGDIADEIEELEEEISDNKEEIEENRKEVEEMLNENESLSSKLAENQRKLREAKERLRTSKSNYQNILDRINKIK